jgi:hypothetical protein
MKTAGARSAWVAGAFGLTLCACLAGGGAAARPGGTLVGAPSPALLLGLLAGAAALAASPRGRSALTPGAGLLPLLAVLLAGAPLTGVRALSGPPLFALLLGALALVLVRSKWRPPGWVFLPAVFLVYTVVAGRTQLRVGPKGDEPHYLMVADSLLRDRDLALQQDYSAGRYTAFHDAPLAPHYRVRGRGGEIYSLHALGLSILILPAYALAGYTGASLFLALLAALLAREIRELVRALAARHALADAAGWAFALSPPLIHYAGLVFTEVPAALAIAFVLRRTRESQLGAGAALAAGLAVAALAWLNVRYVPVALLLLLHALWRQRARAVALLGPVLASVAGLLLYHRALYGFVDPRRVYGRRPELALATLAEGLPGLLLDQEFGLFTYAPFLVLALPGLFFLYRRDRRLGLTALALVAVVVLTAGTWHMWRGGFNPPGRFLVPLIPVLALAVAGLWERRGLTAGAAILLGWSLWTGLSGGWQPQLVHRDRDGTAPFFRSESGAREWTALLPGYVLGEADRHRLAAVWVVALALAVPWRGRAATGIRLAVATLGLAAAGQAASSLSDARTGGRDAARLVGRPALSVPGWRVLTARAEWTTADLDWGPLYEPHRHPDGAEIASRLSLPAGRYELSIEGEDLAPTLVPPGLEVRPEPAGVPRASELVREPAGFRGHLEIRAAERAVSLRLRGGGPYSLRAFSLRPQP